MTKPSLLRTRTPRIRGALPPWLLSVLLVLFLRVTPTTHAWEWSDWIVGGNHDNDATTTTATSFLTMDQVADLRVRDIKRRLARTHGYSAEELARMILKTELVQALAFEEEKVRLKYQEEFQRTLVKQGFVVAVIAVLIVLCWPLIQQGYEVALVNFVVYTDRKKLEARKCWELQTKWGMLGVTLMFIIDLLQAWLTLSILLSWVMRPNKYFFPTPNIPVRPAQFLGGPMEKAFGGYGINVGSMAVTWGLRTAHAQLEKWTGKALSAALKRARQKKKKSKQDDKDNNDDATAAAEKQSRREARRQARQQAAAASTPPPPPDLPPNPWNDPTTNTEQQQTIPTSHAHEEFMQQLETEASGLDELD